MYFLALPLLEIVDLSIKSFFFFQFDFVFFELFEVIYEFIKVYEVFE